MEQSKPSRHHEIDAMRIIALGLLIAYHIFISYQPFGDALNFLRYEKTLQQFWFLGDLLNIWRIPVLFVISGMAVGFILPRRTMKELYADRLMRLVPPLIFGSLVIFPTFPALYALVHEEPVRYAPSPGHLWFVLNLVSYTFLLLPLILWVKRRPDNLLIRVLRATLPWGLLVILPLPLIVETVLTKTGRDAFAFFPIRFGYGLVCYGVGFLLPCLGDRFWISIRRVCHPALVLALLFYLGRMSVIDAGFLRPRPWSMAFESGMWMLAALGYGSLFLNRPSKFFSRLNKAVFPVYILHMPVQQLVAVFLFPVGLGAGVTFLLHCLLTLAICGAIYVWIIRPLPWLHPLMGLKLPLVAAPAARDEAEAPPRSSGWTRFGRGLTLYVLAPLCLIGQVGIVAYLTASRVADSHTPDVKPSKTLWAAAKNNDLAALDRFLTEGEIPVDQPDPKTELLALHWAALNGSTEAAERLLAAGAKVNIEIHDGSTPLSHAAFMGRVDIVQLLIDHGAELNTVNRFDSTPLDSTHAPWSIVIGVARMLDLTVDRDRWEKDKLQVRELLESNGGKSRRELD